MVVIQLSPPELESLIEKSLRKILCGTDLQKPKAKEGKKLLTIDEAADLISLSKARVYTLSSQAKIPNFKKGNRLYFYEDELIAWLESGRRHSQQEIDAMADQSLETA